MSYRVFIGPKGARVFHCMARTKSDAIQALHQQINAMESVYRSVGNHTGVVEQCQHRARLIADSDRIKTERFKPMPSGLHGPLYSAPFGSICK